jgi:hypothetical protein
MNMGMPRAPGGRGFRWILRIVCYVSVFVRAREALPDRCFAVLGNVLQHIN